MKNEIYTEELEANVVAEYINGDPVKDICNRHEIGLKQVDYIIRKNNIARRKPKNKSAKTCSKCRRRINLQAARFCPFCGSDIRTEGEQLAERLTKLCKYGLEVPEQIRDEFISTLKDAAKAVSKNG